MSLQLCCAHILAFVVFSLRSIALLVAPLHQPPATLPRMLLPHVSSALLRPYFGLRCFLSSLDCSLGGSVTSAPCDSTTDAFTSCLFSFAAPIFWPSLFSLFARLLSWWLRYISPLRLYHGCFYLMSLQLCCAHILAFVVFSLRSIA